MCKSVYKKDGLTIKIRPMEKGDMPAAVNIITAHEEFDGNCADKYYTEYFADPIRLERDREQNFVAIDDETGAVIGVCGFAPDYYDTPGILWLTWFYLDGNFRGKGIGRELLHHTLSVIRDLGTNKVFLDTSSHSIYARAVQVYKKYGFKIEGDLVDYYGKGENMTIMGLDLT